MRHFARRPRAGSSSASTLLPRPRRFASRHKLGLTVLVLVLIGFGLVVYLRASQAATPYAAIEAEQGTVTSPATKVADAGASGGQAVLFSGSPPSDGLSKPDETNTGYSGTLSVCTDKTLDTPGQVVKNCSFSGTVTIAADNVRLENSKIVGGTYGVRVNSGVRGAVIDRVEIDGQKNGGMNACVYDQSSAAGFVLANSRLHGCIDGIKAKGGLIQANWIYDLDAGGERHEDCIQVQFGTNYDLSIIGNVCDVNPDGRVSDKSLQLGTENNTCLHNILIEGNWLGGRNSYMIGTSINCGSTQVIARNNRYLRIDPALGQNSGAHGVINGVADVFTCNKWDSSGQTRANSTTITVTKDQLVPGSGPCN